MLQSISSSNVLSLLPPASSFVPASNRNPTELSKENMVNHRVFTQLFYCQKTTAPNSLTLDFPHSLDLTQNSCAAPAGDWEPSCHCVTNTANVIKTPCVVGRFQSVPPILHGLVNESRGITSIILQPLLASHLEDQHGPHELMLSPFLSSCCHPQQTHT